MLGLATRQAAKSASFAEASEDLRELAHLEISPTHLQRLSERIGTEWCAARDGDVEKFRQSKLERTHKEAPTGAAAVMLDGGRVQTRADDDEGRGVRDARWRESKVACCLTLQTQAAASDPQPQPPAKFLEPTQVARLAAEINRRVKGSEKFWLTDGAEAMLQLRAAQLSDDDRWRTNWRRRRPHRAASSHRLAQAA